MGAIETIKGCYSPEHKSAFVSWRENSFRFDGLAAGTLEWLAEDDNIAADIARWRAEKTAHAASLQQRSVATPKHSGDPDASLDQRPLTWKLWSRLQDKIIETIAAVQNRSNDRFEALERRVTALEARPQLKWAGVFRDGQPYTEASLVTDHSGLWVAERTTGARPGGDNSGWRLVAKGR